MIFISLIPNTKKTLHEMPVAYGFRSFETSRLDGGINRVRQETHYDDYQDDKFFEPIRVQLVTLRQDATEAVKNDCEERIQALKREHAKAISRLTPVAVSPAADTDETNEGTGRNGESGLAQIQAEYEAKIQYIEAKAQSDKDKIVAICTQGIAQAKEQHRLLRISIEEQRQDYLQQFDKYRSQALAALDSVSFKSGGGGAGDLESQLNAALIRTNARLAKSFEVRVAELRRGCVEQAEKTTAQLTAQISELKTQVKTCTADLGASRLSLDALRAQDKTNKEKLTKLAADLTACNKDLDDSRANVVRLDKQLKTSKARLTNLEEKLDTLENAEAARKLGIVEGPAVAGASVDTIPPTPGLSKEKERLEADLARQRKAFEEQARELKSASNQLRLVQTQKDTLEKRLQESQETYARIGKRLGAAEQCAPKLAKVRRQLKEDSERHARYRDQAEQAKVKCAKLGKRYSECNSTLKTLRSDIERCNEQKSKCEQRLKAVQQQNKVQAATAQKKSLVLQTKLAKTIGTNATLSNQISECQSKSSGSQKVKAVDLEKQHIALFTASDLLKQASVAIGARLSDWQAQVEGSFLLDAEDPSKQERKIEETTVSPGLISEKLRGLATYLGQIDRRVQTAARTTKEGLNPFKNVSLPEVEDAQGQAVAKPLAKLKVLQKAYTLWSRAVTKLEKEQEDNKALLARLTGEYDRADKRDKDRVFKQFDKRKQIESDLRTRLIDATKKRDTYREALETAEKTLAEASDAYLRRQELRRKRRATILKVASEQGATVGDVLRSQARQYFDPAWDRVREFYNRDLVAWCKKLALKAPELPTATSTLDPDWTTFVGFVHQLVITSYAIHRDSEAVLVDLVEV